MKINNSIKNPNKLTVTKVSKKVYDWDKIWAGIRRARAIKGKGTMSAAEFIEIDRRSH